MDFHNKNSIKIIAKPNSRENKIMGYDKEKDAYIVSIKAKPENNKANIEVIKFCQKPPIRDGWHDDSKANPNHMVFEHAQNSTVNHQLKLVEF